MYPKINIGDFGYQFRKEFDSGWFNGKVVEILPRALSGWDRMCVYEDGDYEDLTLNELKRLATLSLQENWVQSKWWGTWECLKKNAVNV
jgi:hypothetical protein